MEIAYYSPLMGVENLTDSLLLVDDSFLGLTREIFCLLMGPDNLYILSYLSCLSR